MLGGAVVCAALGFEAAAVEPVRVGSATAAADFNQLFQRTNGWVGADAIYSIPISADRTLWFFGDTFVGRVADGRRTNVAMINNSVGVQQGRGAAADVEFFYQRKADGKAAAWLEPAAAGGWLWPFGGAAEDGQAWLFLWQMEKTAGGGAFAFRNVAVWLARIENPLAAPAAWRISQVKIPFTELAGERRRLFGSAVLRVEGWNYIYGIEEPAKGSGAARRMLVARAPAGKVDVFTEWRFWNGEAWVADFRQVRGVVGGMGAEYSVSYMPSLRRYVAVTTENGLSDKIVARAAEQPWGPWSEARVIYNCPEAVLTRRVFCYAGKAHALLDGAGELLVSHAFNSHDFWEVVRDARLYWPRFVIVKLE